MTVTACSVSLVPQLFPAAAVVKRIAQFNLAQRDGDCTPALSVRPDLGCGLVLAVATVKTCTEGRVSETANCDLDCRA